MDIKKEEILKSLEENNGIVTVSCANIGLARSTYYKWLSEDSEFKAAVDEIQDVAIDYVESKLFEKIKGVSISKGFDEEGNPIVYDVPPSDTAIIFYLKTKAKKRGYIERQEVTGAEGKDLNQIMIFKIPDNGRDDNTAAKGVSGEGS